MGEHRDFILAIGLCMLVLIGWQYFIGMPQLEQQKAKQKTITQTTQPNAVPAPPAGATAPAPATPGAVPVPGAVPAPPGLAPANQRKVVIGASARVEIETESLKGSINLKGARIDDLRLIKYRQSVKPGSDMIALFSPSGSANPYYAEYGWANAGTAKHKLPNSLTVWSVPQGAVLKAGQPVTLTWNNGAGLVFKHTIAVDNKFMFTVTQAVTNSTGTAVKLVPYSLVSRHGTPDVQNFYILHEGLAGVLGKDGLEEIDYSDLEAGKPQAFSMTGGWLGFVDKYWAAALIPDQSTLVNSRFLMNKPGAKKLFQVDYVGSPLNVPDKGSAQTRGQLFAGAKVVATVDAYAKDLKIKQFDLLIDWGWFPFLNKPMFWLLDFFFKLVGNFGLAILLATVVIKIVFFPLANKSYVSMSRMKKVQPEMIKIRERYGDDKARQQKAMMELYKKEKINPMSGCLPIMIQIPVFFALYKVLFGSIEMRHTPFFGWIQDLAAPDPTSLFNLFGLIPWQPPTFLMIGVWPLIMGISMFLQMRLNPAPADKIQAQVFNWMPLFFTFLLANFPAGLVIYWAWNNSLSIAQQWFIMSRQGVKVDLLGNIKSMFPNRDKTSKT